MVKRKNNPTNYVPLNDVWTNKGSLQPNNVTYEKCNKCNKTIVESYVGESKGNYNYNNGRYQWSKYKMLNPNFNLGMIFKSNCKK